MEIMAFDPNQDGAFCRDSKKRLTLTLSVPAEGEECGIGMDPIATYRLDWFPASIPHCVVEEAPNLTKATIVSCGHSFNAVALLYHFVKNEMTCPFCRGGHKGARMYWHLLPTHLRVPIRERIELMRTQERRTQEGEDMRALMAMTDSDVNNAPSFSVMMRVHNPMLLVFMYLGPDNAAPFMAKEVRLETSVSTDGTVRFLAEQYIIRELSRNIRIAPISGDIHFETVVGYRSRFGGVTSLLRSQRFRAGTGEPFLVNGGDAKMVFQWTTEGDLLTAELTIPGSDLAALILLTMGQG